MHLYIYVCNLIICMYILYTDTSGKLYYIESVKRPPRLVLPPSDMIPYVLSLFARGVRPRQVPRQKETRRTRPAVAASTWAGRGRRATDGGPGE
jgi:hypothetical protein